MPELPEVETIVRGLARTIVGKTIERVEVRLARIVAAPSARRLRSRAGGRAHRSGPAPRQVRGHRARVGALARHQSAHDRAARHCGERRARMAGDARRAAVHRRGESAVLRRADLRADAARAPRRSVGPRARRRAALLRLYTTSLYRYAVGADDADQGSPPRSAAHRGHRKHLCMRGAVGGSDSSESSGRELDETGDVPLTSRHRRRFATRHRDARNERR